MRKLAILIAGAALLAGCKTAPPPPPPPPPPVDLNNLLMAPGFLAHAASGDQFEIQSSQLALQMSQNPAVRNFANMMISDHARLSQAMAGAATAAGLTPPAPTLLPEQQAALDQLRASGGGPNFDMAYKSVQVSGHQQALGLFQNYSAMGDAPPIKAAAGQAIPAIQMHLSQAQMLNVTPLPPPPPPLPVGQRGERG
jgi:putative membrane protein